MSAKNSRLQLKDYFLKEIQFETISDLRKVPPPLEEFEEINLEIADQTEESQESDNEWHCELAVSSASGEEFGNPYYSFKIVLVGFFSVDDSLEPDTARTLAKSNCPAVLYSTAREIVATLTRRSPYPTVLLPLVTFVEFEDLEPKKEGKKTSKPRRKPKSSKKES